MMGYNHPHYAESLREFGSPRELPQCRGWLLERPVPGTPDRDAMGCYPLFSCQDWSRLHLDLAAIPCHELVSVTLVAEPFGAYDEAYLRRCFPDVVRPFKEHFIVDLGRPRVSRHHRYYARRALRQIAVTVCADPGRFLDEWVRLYTSLCERQNLGGIRAFSRQAFSRQLDIPGLVVLQATARGSTIGAQLWYVQGEVAHSHLTACSPLGYELRAAYALYGAAIEHFAGKVRWLALGAGAGARGDGNDGLSQFKRGWSSGTRTVYLCGRVFDRERYAEAVIARGISATDYFPAYRQGEFV
jgi:hypothetical protein